MIKLTGKSTVEIRNAYPSEFAEIGKMMVKVYSELPEFPGPLEQPEYYHMLTNIGELTRKPHAELVVSVSSAGKILGAVVYFEDMKYYGSGGSAPEQKDAAGFRLLAVDPAARGQGIGRKLSEECINRARNASLLEVIIHSTQAMQVAWKMYEKLGFERSPDLDFMQDTIQVYGFRLNTRDQKTEI